jgi:hypothetical protein
LVTTDHLLLHQRQSVLHLNVRMPQLSVTTAPNSGQQLLRLLRCLLPLLQLSHSLQSTPKSDSMGSLTPHDSCLLLVGALAIQDAQLVLLHRMP